LFLDLTRHYGRAPRGERAVEAVPRNRGRATTLLASMTPDGLGPVVTYPGGTTTERFLTYLTEHLLPTLTPGQVLLLDNARAHHGRGVAEACADAGVEVCYLPPYSPDFNPIEPALGTVKNRLRRDKPRTTAAVAAALPRALAQVTAEQARAYFRHGGYLLPETAP
jgi:transposase